LYLAASNRAWLFSTAAWVCGDTEPCVWSMSSVAYACMSIGSIVSRGTNAPLRLEVEAELSSPSICWPCNCPLPQPPANGSAHAPPESPRPALAWSTSPWSARATSAGGPLSPPARLWSPAARLRSLARPDACSANGDPRSRAPERLAPERLAPERLAPERLAPERLRAPERSRAPEPFAAPCPTSSERRSPGRAASLGKVPELAASILASAARCAACSALDGVRARSCWLCAAPRAGPVCRSAASRRVDAGSGRFAASLRCCSPRWTAFRSMGCRWTGCRWMGCRWMGCRAIKWRICGLGSPARSWLAIRRECSSRRARKLAAASTCSSPGAGRPRGNSPPAVFSRAAVSSRADAPICNRAAESNIAGCQRTRRTKTRCVRISTS
jgi:hypothetical protein